MSAFDRCVAKMKKRVGVYSPRGLCATIGRRALGEREMARRSAAGRRNPLKHDYRVLLRHHARDAAEEYRRMPAPEVVARLGEAAMDHLGVKLSAHDRAAALRQFYTDFGAAVAGTKRNPAVAAADAYERFHGRPAGEEVEVVTEVHEHDYVWSLGTLEKLVVISDEDGETEIELSGFKGAMLTANEDGSQLYIDGGDQSVDLDDFGLGGTTKERVVLGELSVVEYFTRKDHLGDQGGTAVYVHQMGEEGGRLPILLYRVRDELLEVAGGDYTMPAEGIRD